MQDKNFGYLTGHKATRLKDNQSSYEGKPVRFDQYYKKKRCV